MGQLEGHVALITGGAGSLGKAIGRAMVNQGARIVVTDVQEPQGRSVADTFGDHAIFEPLDVQCTEQWRAAVRSAEAVFGKLTVLVNNASLLGKGGVVDVDQQEWDHIMSVNLTGSFKGMRAAAPAMERAGGGSIINISSTAGLKGFPERAAYCTSKWGVRGLTKHGALDLASRNIRVNSIHPGHLVNQMLPQEAPSSKPPAYVPMQRRGKSEEIVGMVVYLASDASAYCTGAEFVADGGEMAGQVELL